MAAAIPYVVGQWVRGERFYGRGELLAAVLRGARRRFWLPGTRRIGKTSMLRQLEHLANRERPELVPVVWDLQGAADPGELRLSLDDALLDAEPALERAGVRASEAAQGDAPATLEALRHRLAAAGKTLLLLCDEAEELIALGRSHPQLLQRLGRELGDADGLRVVLTSSMRLRVLASGAERPFLEPFMPPVFVGPLRDDAAAALVRQDQLPAELRPEVAREDVEAIRELSGNHPYLVQILCKRLAECGDVRAAAEQIAADRMVNHFFQVDFEILEAAGREALLRLVHGPLAIVGDTCDELAGLQAMGLLRRRDDGRLEAGSWFLQRWLAAAMGGDSG